MRALLLAVLSVATLRCGSPKPAVDAGQGSDGGDQPPDSGVVVRVTPARELTAGGGRLTGGSFVMDVSLGPGVSTVRASGPGLVMEANVALKP